MKLFLKLTFIFVIPLLVTVLSSKNSYAVSYSISPEALNENSPAATVTFSGLQSGREYFYCLKGNEFIDCLDHNGIGFVSATAASEKITLTVCGAGENDLKTSCGAGDYFHPTTYHVRLYLDRNDQNSQRLADANLNVQRYIPKIDISPRTGIKPNNPITISVTGSRRLETESKRNNYQITIYGDNGTPRPSDNEKCFEVPAGGTGSGSFTASTGDYHIEVREQVRESEPCSGDFLYKMYKLNVSEAGGSVTGETDAASTGIGSNPCGTNCPTGLGNLPVSLKGLADRILRIGIGIAGGIALILIVVGAIRVLISGGDPQKVNGGREMIIAAVAGLIFLIFTTVILEFLGVNILGGVPGIGSP